MDYMDLAVRCLRKAVKLNNSLAHSFVLTRYDLAFIVFMHYNKSSNTRLNVSRVGDVNVMEVTEEQLLLLQNQREILMLK